MNILSTKQIKEIDKITTDLHDFIHNLQNDSLEKVIDKRNSIYELNRIRIFCELPPLNSYIPFRLMPEVEPPRGGISAQAEHEHNFQVVSNNAHSVCVMCTKCAATKYISPLPPLPTLSQEEQNNDE